MTRTRPQPNRFRVGCACEAELSGEVGQHEVQPEDGHVRKLEDLCRVHPGRHLRRRRIETYMDACGDGLTSNVEHWRLNEGGGSHETRWVLEHTRMQCNANKKARKQAPCWLLDGRPMQTYHRCRDCRSRISGLLPDAKESSMEIFFSGHVCEARNRGAPDRGEARMPLRGSSLDRDQMLCYAD